MRAYTFAVCANVEHDNSVAKATERSSRFLVGTLRETNCFWSSRGVQDKWGSLRARHADFFLRLFLGE